MSSKLIVREIRRRIWRPTGLNERGIFDTLSLQAAKSIILVQIFYAINFYIWIKYLGRWNSLDKLIIVDPVWPILWMRYVANPSYWVKIIMLINLFFAGLVAIRPAIMLFRVFACLGLFFFSAVLNSDLAGWPRMGSSTFCYVLFSFLFIFLPRDLTVHKRIGEWRIVFIVVIAQITLFLSYASSAIWRIRFQLEQAIHGRPLTILSDGLDLAISAFRFTSGHTGVLGPFLVENHLVSAPGMALATIFELSCLWVVTRPGLYNIWGFLIMIFHLGFVLTMNLQFDDHLLLITLFLMGSPFVRSWRFEILEQAK